MTPNPSTHDVTRDPRLVPFRVNIAQEDLDDLRARIARTRLPAALPDDDWGTGVPVDHLRSVLALWASHDWRATEERLNRLPQFTTVINGQQIHFIHVRSVHSGAVPLLITHGWPGSFLEFEKLIGPLTARDWSRCPGARDWCSRERCARCFRVRD